MMKTQSPISISLALVILILVPASVTCGESGDFTGNYMSGGESSGILMYLALTQSRGTVMGSLIIVTPNHQGDTEQRNLTLEGIADGGHISVTAKQKWPLNDITLNGEKLDDDIRLAFPADSGSLTAPIFATASFDEFNSALNKWRRSLGSTYATAERTREEREKEQNEIKNLAGKLAEEISQINGTRIPDNIIEADSLVIEERQRLQEMEQMRKEISMKASAHRLTCYQAFETLGFMYGKNGTSGLGFMYGKNGTSGLGYANRRFRKVAEELEGQFARGDMSIRIIRSTAIEFEKAVRSTKYPLSDLPANPSDEKEPVAAYELIRVSARSELSKLRGENKEILDRADKIMTKAGQAVEQVQALMKRRCRK